MGQPINPSKMELGIISYCTHSGLRLKQSNEIGNSLFGRLYLIARIADCDNAIGYQDCQQQNGLYLIARIADCDCVKVINT